LSCNNQFLDTTSLRSKYNAEEFNALQKEVIMACGEHLFSFDMTSFIEMENMGYGDQYTRSFYIEDKCCQQLLTKSDSLYRSNALNTFKEFDFTIYPDEMRIDFLVILIHIVQSDVNNIYEWEPILYNALINRKITPKEFSLIIDGYYSRHFSKAKYGNYNSKINEFTPFVDIQKVDEFRKAIGLPRLIDYIDNLASFSKLIKSPEGYIPMDYCIYYGCD